MNGLNLLEAWFRRVWLDGDLDAVDAMFPATTAASGLMDFAIGPADLKALVPAFLAQVEAPSLSFERVIESGSWVAALIHVTGTALATGRPISVSGQLMARIENGTFAEAYNTFDMLAFFEQIGALPENATALALAGEPICP